ncbi:MAG: hypothetical protein K0R46_1840 [Herbinix sp.]|nr:hypothetical protein [Herbinix sp.]
MPNKRDLSLHKYEIETDLYRELFYFCKRYQSREDEARSLYGLSEVCQDGMPKGNETGDQTANKAMQINKLRADNELIEQTAIEADPYIYQYIVKNVTLGITYEYMNVPCGRRQFYEKRRLFFKLLSEKR